MLFYNFKYIFSYLLRTVSNETELEKCLHYLQVCTWSPCCCYYLFVSTYSVSWKIWYCFKQFIFKTPVTSSILDQQMGNYFFNFFSSWKLTPHCSGVCKLGNSIGIIVVLEEARSILFNLRRSFHSEKTSYKIIRSIKLVFLYQLTDQFPILRFHLQVL